MYTHKSKFSLKSEKRSLYTRQSQQRLNNSPLILRVALFLSSLFLFLVLSNTCVFFHVLFGRFAPDRFSFISWELRSFVHSSPSSSLHSVLFLLLWKFYMRLYCCWEEELLISIFTLILHNNKRINIKYESKFTSIRMKVINSYQF